MLLFSCLHWSVVSFHVENKLWLIEVKKQLLKWPNITELQRHNGNTSCCGRVRRAWVSESKGHYLEAASPRVGEGT